jgi:2',3'-cyclic-nucleotide 2'-phosphodiesterase (5'-nucleotidase family)
LVVDAGNALFRVTGPIVAKEDEERATFVLEAMGAMGTRAMAAGVRDLSAGVPFLRALAKKSGVAVLSANLMVGEALAFPAFTVVKLKGLKVGVIGATAAGPVPGVEARAGPVFEAVQREAAALRKVTDAIVVLAAVPYAEALELSTKLGTQVDVILQSTEMRGSVGQENAGNFLVSGGQRGQLIGWLDVAPKGKGPWIDLEAVARDRQQLEFLDNQLGELKKRQAAALDAASKKTFQPTVDTLEKRRAEQAARVAAAVAPGARTLRLRWLTLDDGVVDDPELKKQALVIEPTYKGSH